MSTEKTKSAQARVVAEASKYLGQKEISGNMGFREKWFDKLMRWAGFYNSAPWCAFVSKVVWVKALPEQPDLARLMTGSALSTYERLERAGYTTSTEPTQGALMVWRHYKKGRPVGRNAHIGVCDTGANERETVVTYEGNTNSAGGREGNEYCKKLRDYSSKAWKVDDGLRLLGFIACVDPAEWLTLKGKTVISYEGERPKRSEPLESDRATFWKRSKGAKLDDNLLAKVLTEKEARQGLAVTRAT
jgi:hypothetical protein